MRATVSSAVWRGAIRPVTVRHRFARRSKACRTMSSNISPTALPLPGASLRNRRCDRSSAVLLVLEKAASIRIYLSEAWLTTSTVMLLMMRVRLTRFRSRQGRSTPHGHGVVAVLSPGRAIGRARRTMQPSSVEGRQALDGDSSERIPDQRSSCASFSASPWRSTCRANPAVMAQRPVEHLQSMLRGQSRSITRTEWTLVVKATARAACRYFSIELLPAWPNGVCSRSCP